WLGHGRLRPIGRILAVIAVLALIGAVGYLTAQAWVEDQEPATFVQPEKTKDPATGDLVANPKAGQHVEPYFTLREFVAGYRYDAGKAEAFQREMREADERAHRAIQLAGVGIPAEGGRYLLRRDPITKGKQLFKERCGSCHSCGEQCKNPNPTASDL